MQYRNNQRPAHIKDEPKVIALAAVRQKSLLTLAGPAGLATLFYCWIMLLIH